MKNVDIINQPLSTLPFSEDLKKCLSNANVTCIAEVLSLTPFQWHKKFNNFNYHHQQEILNFLKTNNLFHLLQEE